MLWIHCKRQVWNQNICSKELTDSDAGSLFHDIWADFAQLTMNREALFARFIYVFFGLVQDYIAESQSMFSLEIKMQCFPKKKKCGKKLIMHQLHHHPLLCLCLWVTLSVWDDHNLGPEASARSHPHLCSFHSPHLSVVLFMPVTEL